MMKSLIAEGKTTALDLFTEPFLSDGLTNTYDIEIAPTRHTDRVIQFTEPGHPDHFLDLSQVYLSLEFVVMKTGVADPIPFSKTEDKMQLPALLIDSLFSRSVVTLNRQEVGDTSDNFAQRNWLLYELGYDGSAANSLMYTIGLHKSSGALYTPAMWVDNATNTVVRVIGRQVAGVFSTPRLLLPDIELGLKFQIAEKGGYYPKDSEYKDHYIKINRATLTIRRVCVNPKIAHAIERQLKHAPAVYPYHRIGLEIDTVPKGWRSSAVIPICTHSSKFRNVLPAHVNSGHSARQNFHWIQVQRQASHLQHKALRIRLHRSCQKRQSVPKGG